MALALNVLKAVWGRNKGYVFVPRRNPKRLDSRGKPIWDEGRAFNYPSEWNAIEARVKQSIKEGYDIYWCPLLFSHPKRLKEYVHKHAGILWADLDKVDPRKLGELKPSIAWASSHDRYQGLWLLDGDYPIEDVEKLNRDLTYTIGADKGGWDVTQVLRVPGSLNHKYDPPQEGRYLWGEKRLYSLDTLKSLVVVDTSEPEFDTTEEGLESLIDGWDLPPRAIDLLNVSEDEVEVGERSDRLWELETLLVEAGLPVFKIVQIIQKSPWNKFKGRRNEMKQIYHEVLKAEQHVKARLKDKKEETKTSLLDPEAKKLKEQMWAIPYSIFMTKDMQPPEWLVEGIWQKGTYGMIAGEPKTFKSVQATDLALSVASGEPFLGVFPVHKTGPVLYVQEENNEQTMQDRIKKIADQKGLWVETAHGWGLPDDLPMYFSNNYGIDLTQKDSRLLLENTIAELHPILLVLDPLYMMLGQADENSAKEVGDVLRWLTYLRNQYKTTILICHHYNKSGNSTRGGQRVRGTGAFHAWVESALYVKKPSEPGRIKVEREFRAHPPMAELDITIDIGEPGELWYTPIVADSEDDRSISLKKEEICTVLSVSSRGFDEIKELVKMTRAECRKALRELEMDGLIYVEKGGGRGQKTKYMLTTGGAELVKEEVDV